MLPSAAEKQTIWQIFNASFALWRKGFREFFPLTLGCVLIASLPYFFIPALNTHNIILLDSFIAKHQFSTLFYVLFLITSFSVILVQIQQNLIAKNTNNTLHVLSIAVRKLPYTFIASIILLILLYVGLGLFIIPGVIIGILLTAYYPLIIIDHENPIQALQHSYQLVWHEWWRTAVIILIPVIFSWTVAYIIEQNAAHVFAIKFANGGEIWLLHHILRMVFSIFYFPWFCILLLIQFYDLKLRNQTSSPLDPELEISPI